MRRKFYLGFRYFCGRNTTTGRPNKVTGYYSNAGDLVAFKTEHELFEWINEERLGYPCGLGGGERIRVTVKEARNLCLGESMEEFTHTLDMIIEDLKDEEDEEGVTARIHEEINGYHVSDDAWDYLDARGQGLKTKAEALRYASLEGYTYATGSGTYWKGIRVIPKRFRIED